MATLIFANGTFELQQKDIALFATIVHVLEDCSTYDRIIRIPEDICSNVRKFSRIAKKYRAMFKAGCVKLSRASQFELYLDGVFSYTMDIKEVLEALGEPAITLDLGIFCFLQKYSRLRDALRQFRIPTYLKNWETMERFTFAVCARGNIDEIRDLSALSNHLCDLIRADGYYVAMIYNRLDILEYLRNDGTLWNTERGAFSRPYTNINASDISCALAAREGYIEVLEWAYKNGCPQKDYICIIAAMTGNLELLKWARAKGCPRCGHSLVPWVLGKKLSVAFSDLDCVEAIAARYGHLNILKWAHAEGCSWNERTTTLAAMEGNFDILSWLRENGAPWDTQRAIRYAAMVGQFEVYTRLRSMRENIP